MFDCIGEVLECADRNGLLWRILAGAVGLGDEGNDHLYVPFGAKSTRLQQWLTVVHTPPVHIHTWKSKHDVQAIHFQL